MNLLSLLVLIYSSFGVMGVITDSLPQQHQQRRLILGGYVMCVGFRTQTVSISMFILYSVLGFFFDARSGACIGRDGWVWGLEGDSCTTACDSAGGMCSVEGTQQVNSVATARFIGSKYQDLVAFNCGDDYIDSDAPGVPFTIFDKTLNRLLCTYTIPESSSPTTCDDAIANARRICCCDVDLCKTS